MVLSFKGRILTGNRLVSPCFSHKIWGVPVNVRLNHFIELRIIEILANNNLTVASGFTGQITERKIGGSL